MMPSRDIISKLIGPTIGSYLGTFVDPEQIIMSLWIDRKVG